MLSKRPREGSLFCYGLYCMQQENVLLAVPGDPDLRRRLFRSVHAGRHGCYLDGYHLAAGGLGNSHGGTEGATLGAAGGILLAWLWRLYGAC